MTLAERLMGAMPRTTLSDRLSMMFVSPEERAAQMAMRYGISGRPMNARTPMPLQTVSPIAVRG